MKYNKLDEMITDVSTDNGVSESIATTDLCREILHLWQVIGSMDEKIDSAIAAVEDNAATIAEGQEDLMRHMESTHERITALWDAIPTPVQVPYPASASTTPTPELAAIASIRAAAEEDPTLLPSAEASIASIEEALYGPTKELQHKLANLIKSPCEPLGDVMWPTPWVTYAPLPPRIRRALRRLKHAWLRFTTQPWS